MKKMGNRRRRKSDEQTSAMTDVGRFFINFIMVGLALSLISFLVFDADFWLVFSTWTGSGIFTLVYASLNF